MKIDKNLLDKLASHHITIAEFKTILFNQHNCCIVCHNKFHKSLEIVVYKGVFYCAYCYYKSK
jgi:hypothetical protein